MQSVRFALQRLQNHCEEDLSERNVEFSTKDDDDNKPMDCILLDLFNESKKWESTCTMTSNQQSVYDPVKFLRSVSSSGVHQAPRIYYKKKECIQTHTIDIKIE
jgi:hypothetical protein